MDRKIFFNFTIYDLWKLFGATILFFLALVLGVKEVWEPATMIQIDYLAEETKPDHQSAEWKHTSDPLILLCRKNQILCDKIVWTGAISDQEKLSYATQYIEIIQFLDQHLIKWADIKQVFKTLIINGEKGKRRGGATWKRITMNLASMGDPSEFWGVLTHEFGHIVDLGVLHGNSEIKNGNYTEFGKVKFAIDDPSLEYYKYSRLSENTRNQSVKKKDFCSGYGMTNPFEDFAECHNLYLNNKNLFKIMASETQVMKNKYNFFANLFGNQALQEGNQELLYTERRPRDTTVL